MSHFANDLGNQHDPGVIIMQQWKPRLLFRQIVTVGAEVIVGSQQ
jgi:hypothetical protein